MCLACQVLHTLMQLQKWEIFGSNDDEWFSALIIGHVNWLFRCKQGRWRIDIVFHHNFCQKPQQSTKRHILRTTRKTFFCQMHFIIGSNKPLKKAKNSTTLIMTYYFMLAIIFFALSKRRVVTNQLSVSKPTLGQKGKNVKNMIDICNKYKNRVICENWQKWNCDFCENMRSVLFVTIYCNCWINK